MWSLLSFQCCSDVGETHQLAPSQPRRIIVIYLFQNRAFAYKASKGILFYSFQHHVSHHHAQSLRITLLSLVLDGNGLKMSLIVNPILSFNHLFYTNFIFAVDVAKSVGIFLKRLTTSNSMSSSGRMLCLLINSMKLDEFLITGEVFWKSIKTEDAHSKRELMWVEVHMQTHKGSTISAKRYVKLTK